MKRFKVLLAILCLAVSSLWSHPPWGSTPEQTITIMGEPTSRGWNKYVYLYPNNVGMMEAHYYFISRKLRKMVVIYKMQYLEQIIDYLNKNYGTGYTDTGLWGKTFLYWIYPDYNIFITFEKGGNRFQVSTTQLGN